jgi:hypothetical protein
MGRNKCGVGHGVDKAKERKGNKEPLKLIVTVNIHNLVSHYDTV